MGASTMVMFVAGTEARIEPRIPIMAVPIAVDEVPSLMPPAGVPVIPVRTPRPHLH